MPFDRQTSDPVAKEEWENFQWAMDVTSTIILGSCAVLVGFANTPGTRVRDGKQGFPTTK
jgi:hypothetical protein|tara:strand:+ start:1706 stop:1885 length:180 start_codon:yes stop_codon:yes gene_type:complete